MALLRHEVWLDPEGLPGMCLAGPMGDGLRALLEPGSRLVATIEGSSHFDAMTKYYAMMGWGAYATEFQEDYSPYPNEWLEVQHRAGR